MERLYGSRVTLYMQALSRTTLSVYTGSCFYTICVAGVHPLLRLFIQNEAYSCQQLKQTCDRINRTLCHFGWAPEQIPHSHQQYNECQSAFLQKLALQFPIEFPCEAETTARLRSDAAS
jgi:hypothetical protein